MGCEPLPIREMKLLVQNCAMCYPCSNATNDKPTLRVRVSIVGITDMLVSGFVALLLVLLSRSYRDNVVLMVIQCCYHCPRCFLPSYSAATIHFINIAAVALTSQDSQEPSTLNPTPLSCQVPRLLPCDSRGIATAFCPKTLNPKP